MQLHMLRQLRAFTENDMQYWLRKVCDYSGRNAENQAHSPSDKRRTRASLAGTVRNEPLKRRKWVELRKG